MRHKQVSSPLLVAALLGLIIVVTLLVTSHIFRSLFFALLVFCFISLIISNRYKVYVLILCLTVGCIFAAYGPKSVAAENNEVTTRIIKITPEPAPPVESVPPEENTAPNCNLDPMWNEHPNITQWESLLETACGTTKIDVNLLAALIMQESKGDPNAYSSSGAVGLMQVMPRDGIAATFQCINGPCFSNRPTSRELYDPTFNIGYGSNFFLGKLDSCGSVYDALMAYNGGGDPEYAQKVLNFYNQHQSH